MLNNNDDNSAENNISSQHHKTSNRKKKKKNSSVIHTDYIKKVDTTSDVENYSSIIQNLLMANMIRPTVI